MQTVLAEPTFEDILTELNELGAGLGKIESTLVIMNSDLNSIDESLIVT